MTSMRYRWSGHPRHSVSAHAERIRDLREVTAMAVDPYTALCQVGSTCYIIMPADGSERWPTLAGGP
jgi:hypothetical protein